MGPFPYDDKAKRFIVTFTSLPWRYRLLYSPVLGRRVGRTLMEESKTLGNGYLNSTEKYRQSTKSNEGTIISNWYLRLSFIE